MFQGTTYDPALDQDRLEKQLGRVWAALDAADRWLTLRELGLIAAAPEASVSARIRDLRKRKFGGYTVDRKRIGDSKSGLWAYKLQPKPGAEPGQTYSLFDLKETYRHP